MMSDDREITPHADRYINDFPENTEGWVDAQGRPEIEVGNHLIGRPVPTPRTDDPERDALYREPKWVKRFAAAREKANQPRRTAAERYADWQKKRGVNDE
jgi:hypothetical protein